LIASLGEPTVKEKHGRGAVAARNRGEAPSIRSCGDEVNAGQDRFTLNRQGVAHRGAMRSRCDGRLRVLGVGGTLQPPRCSGGGIRLCSCDNWRSRPYWARSLYRRVVAVIAPRSAKPRLAVGAAPWRFQPSRLRPCRRALGQRLPVQPVSAVEEHA
jgi:hypothetical protein